MKNEVNSLIFKILSDVMPVLALRGADEFARSGGDLDFLTPPGKAIMACHIVAQAAEKQGWFLVHFRNIGYLAQIILVRPIEGGTDDAIKIDFFDGLRWYGVGQDVAGCRLFEKILAQHIYDMSLVGAANFFQKVLAVGQLSERDWARVTATGANLAYLTETAKTLGLPIAQAQIEKRGATGIAKWRLRAASGGAGGPLTALVWLIKATAAHFKFKMGVGTSAGLVLNISGLDGSGKSTLIDRLLSAYKKAGGEQPTLVHLLPSWIPLPHQLLRRHQTITNYTKPYSDPPVSSRLNGGLRLAYYIITFAIAKLALGVSAKRGRQIILDRSFLDFASDPTRSRIPVQKLPPWLVRLLMPAGCLFYLDASPDVVVARKGELTLERASSLQMHYCNNSAIIGAKLLGGDNKSDVVFKELLGHLSHEYMQRLVKITKMSK